MATKTSWQNPSKTKSFAGPRKSQNFFLGFKQWGKSHSLHQPTAKLPLRLTVNVHEDVVDFVHGCLIGLLIGFILGLFLTKTLKLF